MKILVIDRDEIVTQLISSHLEAKGHDVVIETIKNEAIESLSKETFDLIFLDPSPMKDARAMALNIRRSARSYPYIILMTTDEVLATEDVIQMGCNDLILKPLDKEAINAKVDNAARLMDLFENLTDTSEDFPSAGGVIAKSAFNQLCLSAMERGERYNEMAFILALRVENFKEMSDLDGKYVAEYSVSKMAHHMVRMRRLSDIIGQTRKNEYSLLLQRTQNKAEAIDAAKRFAATFDEIDDFLPAEGKEVTIGITLIHLPTGELSFEHSLEKKVEIPNR